MPRPTKFAFIANISVTPLFLNICSALADRADFQAKLIFFKHLPVKRMAMVLSGCQGVAWLETQVPLNLTINESKLEQYCRAVFECLQSIPKKGSTSSTAHLLVPITINKPLLPNPSKTTSEIYNVRVSVVVFFTLFFMLSKGKLDREKPVCSLQGRGWVDSRYFPRQPWQPQHRRKRKVHNKTCGSVEHAKSLSPSSKQLTSGYIASSQRTPGDRREA